MKRPSRAPPGGSSKYRSAHLGRHRRGEGAELLALLDVAVEAVAHRGVVRRRQDAAVAERAGAELERAVHPADDLARRRASAATLFDQSAPSLGMRRQSGSRPRAATRASSAASDDGTPERMIGDLAVGLSEMDSIGIERRAQRAAGIARRGRDEQPLEADLRAADARWRTPLSATPPPRQRSGRPVSACRRAGDVDQHLLEHRAARSPRCRRSAALRRVARSIGWYGIPRRTEEVDEARRERPLRRSSESRSIRGRAGTRHPACERSYAAPPR